jgi:Domain of unknown function (DUF4118)
MRSIDPVNDSERSDNLLIAAPLAIVSMGLAAAMVPLRTRVTPTTIALALMVVVVVAAAFGGRLAGVLTALAVTVSYDFWFTRPYLSLKVDSADDVEITVLLLVCGLIVGALAARAHRSVVDASWAKGELRHVHRLAEMVACGASTADVVAVAEQQLTELLSLQGCSFESPSGTENVAVLHRSGALDGLHLYRVARVGFELPRPGLALPVLAEGREVGRFILSPTEGVGTSIDQRVVAVAVADQVGAAIALRDLRSQNERNGNG